MPQAPPNRPRILLVEDDDVLADVLVTLLGRIAQVMWAASAEAAIDRLADHDWDLFVVDIGLPGMDGLSFVEQARTRAPEAAALMLSSHSEFEYAVGAIRAGADDYLVKPVDPAELLAKVEQLIALAAERKAANREVVLAVGAHPDDVEIGVGGILLRHAAMGDDVNVLTMTGGEQGGEPGARAIEAQAAADLMGARLFLTDLQDTSVHVSDGGVTIGTIKRVIDEIRPTTIYTHTLLDVHQDHRNVHHATLVAARGIPRVFCYQAPSTTVEFQPTRFVAMDDFMQRKLDVIEVYTSQVTTRGYLDADLLRSTARYWSRFTTARYVEPLAVIRDSDADPTVTASTSEPPDA